MFVRQCFRTKNGKRHAYWALVESYRTQRGPRQRVVAWLGDLDEQGRLGVEAAAGGRRPTRRQPTRRQPTLFEEPQPRWVRVDAAAIRVENCRQFGGPWLALELIQRLRLEEFLKEALPRGSERVPWSLTALILVIARLCEPSSELFVAEQWYPNTALPELLGVPTARVDDNRLYRTLDQLLPHKAALEQHLKERLGELFDLEYDLLLYDVTSTYFEGRADFPLAQRGYSRDQRSDCKQVCIALVVSRCGMPLGYELFAGNTIDVTTVETIVTTMESRYGRSQRVWVMDRGMISEENIEFLKAGERRYIVGTPKPLLKRFEAELLTSDWREIQAGVEVKVCTAPDGGVETFILCRSRDRAEKDLAIVRRFEERIEQRLQAMAQRCARQHRDPQRVEREVGRLLGQNTRAARLFEVTVKASDDGSAQLTCRKITERRDWATLSAGCYLLRSNVTDWTDEELWRAYMQLTEAEAAFRIHKSDLSLRPIWHQKEERVRAHILVCFLAYVLWKTLAGLIRQAGLGDEPRRVLSELSELRAVDVVLPTAEGIELRRRCVTRPTEHQSILLHRLGLNLPASLKPIEM
jgi:transposase